MTKEKNEQTKVPPAEPVALPQQDAEPAKSDGASKYKVTKKAGLYVAGKRSPGVGKEITLSEQQAQYPLLNGEIEKA